MGGWGGGGVEVGGDTDIQERGRYTLTAQGPPKTVHLSSAGIQNLPLFFSFHAITVPRLPRHQHECVFV